MIKRILTIASTVLALAWIGLAIASYALVCLRGQWGNYTFPLFKVTGEFVTELDPDGTEWCLRDEHGAFTTWQVGPDINDYVYFYSPGLWIERSSRPFSITVFLPAHYSRSSPGFTPSGVVPYVFGYFVIDGQLAIEVCFWFPITLFSIVPLLWLVGRLRLRRRRKHNRCVACGYSLMGNISGICPECGQAVPAVSALPGQGLDAPD